MHCPVLVGGPLEYLSSYDPISYKQVIRFGFHPSKGEALNSFQLRVDCSQVKILETLYFLSLPLTLLSKKSLKSR